ncbi:kinase-like domain-containing protein [Glomus cerebriforme]|uniref:Kinase-like domain-containing protein n=1 Tax=Glomus cerebriforme TaxID=658196 RepID=A0A397SDB1_9GLOM|nr:kinase-like domain-containing protein [Glomus cerebriforme]
MDFPDHVLFNINVAVVAMILRKRYGFEFEREDDSKSIKSDEMWEMTEQLHNTLLQCLGTDDAILQFINWFFDGVRKTFETENNFPSRNTSSFSLQHQQQILLFPDICFQCKRPYSSTTPQDKWCNTCESYLFESKFHTWTSGNVELDRFIRQTQQEATDSTDFLRWIDFSAFTDVNPIGKGGFSEVYSGKYTKDRLDGTLKQWVTNMEYQIILNYLKYRNEEENEDPKDISPENWEAILTDFVTKMRYIYRDRKVLKCKPRDLSEEKPENKVKRTNSFTRLKSLLKRRPSKNKKKNRSIVISKLVEPMKITQVPVTVSPLRSKFIPKTVVLKRLVDSQNLSSSFVREMRAEYLSLKKSSKIPRMYGLTQDPETKDYYIVLQYANEFDLHTYLVQNCVSIDWWQRISILDGIVKGIYEIHKADLIHHNLHTGNILVRRNTRRKEAEKMSLRNPSSSVKIWISDSGLWGPASSSSPNSVSGSASSIGGNSNRNSIITPDYSVINTRKGIYGVLPYIAPEILQGKEYTKSSDIYSLGMIMWELSNSATLKRQQRHKRPYHDQLYDINLAKEIVINEKRPEHAVPPVIPECWLDLMKKCWASNPEDRPSIEDIMKITDAWNMERRKSLNLESRSSLVFSLSQGILGNNNTTDENIVGQFLEAEKRRIERLNKGKQVERDNEPKLEEKDDESKEDKSKDIYIDSIDATETVYQEEDDDDIHPDALMKSRLIDFLVEIPHENLDVIYENSNSPKEYYRKEIVEKEKVDSGYQREDELDDESLEQKEKIKQIDDETEPEIQENDSNKYIEEKQLEPILVQEDKTKHVKIDDNQIEANSETGSKEISITKEKEP